MIKNYKGKFEICDDKNINILYTILDTFKKFKYSLVKVKEAEEILDGKEPNAKIKQKTPEEPWWDKIGSLLHAKKKKKNNGKQTTVYPDQIYNESIDKVESNNLKCETKSTVKENSSKRKKIKSLKFPFISTKNTSVKSKEVIDNRNSKG